MSTQGFRDTQLETVVSKVAGTPLVVLRGRHAGATGRLLAKAAGAATVELTEDRTAVELQLDDVADFTGLLHGEDF